MSLTCLNPCSLVFFPLSFVPKLMAEINKQTVPWDPTESCCIFLHPPKPKLPIVGNADQHNDSPGLYNKSGRNRSPKPHESMSLRTHLPPLSSDFQTQHFAFVINQTLQYSTKHHCLLCHRRTSLKCLRGGVRSSFLWVAVYFDKSLRFLLEKSNPGSPVDTANWCCLHRTASSLRFSANCTEWSLPHRFPDQGSAS